MSAFNHNHSQNYSWSTKEVQRSVVLSQFISSFSDQPQQKQQQQPSANALKQLQLELEQISTRAAERAAQLELSQTQVIKGKPGHLTNSATAQPSKQTLSSAASRAASASLETTKTPNTDHPASKRVKSSQTQTQASRLASGSDSEQSLASGSQGKYFQTESTTDNSPLSSANAAAAGANPMGPPPVPPKMRHSSGTPVQDDFSRVKVSSQVPIQTFWASLEPYFRNITDDDIAFLASSSDSQESYVVPKLGKFYAQKWAEEEVSHFPDHMHNSKTKYTAKHLLSVDSRLKTAIPERSFAAADLIDSDLSLNAARLAPLTERIISALVAEKFVIQDPSNAQDEDSGGALDSNSDSRLEINHISTNGDTVSLEDRLKRELRYIGILDEEEINWDDRQDDEVCATLRALQRQLREQVKVNEMRKERLLSVANDHIGHQEYTQMVDELDKQIEQSYLKRHRLTKSRKRKSSSVKTVALSDNALNAMDKRRQVIDAIGHMFPPEMFDIPQQSIYEAVPENPDISIR
ncbi:Transcriptional regulator [Coemansia asiatica]|uniref:Transcriptional regulator n=1 Tax=Coemansia asiatica TaxID=1052880 RepID=A0A9W7XHJ8_9FUNG|nr:Transcriptional regulator [Coemansia asiatica]